MEDSPVPGATSHELVDHQRSMDWHGEELDEAGELKDVARCAKDFIADRFLFRAQNLFGWIAPVFLHTTSINFEGPGSRNSDALALAMITVRTSDRWQWVSPSTWRGALLLAVVAGEFH